METSDDPLEMARRCREYADATNDESIADFLRELAEDYEEMARAKRGRDESR